MKNKAEPWQYVRLPLNMGGCRDIPPGALFHRAVVDRLKLNKDHDDVHYHPRNDVNFTQSVGGRQWHLSDAEDTDGAPQFEECPEQAVTKEKSDKIYKLKL